MNNFNNMEIERVKKEYYDAKALYNLLVLIDVAVFLVGYALVDVTSHIEMSFLGFIGGFLIIGSIIILLFPIIVAWNKVSRLKMQIDVYNAREQKMQQVHRERMVDENIGNDIAIDDSDFATKTMKKIGGVSDKLESDISYDEQAQQARTKIVRDSLNCDYTRDTVHLNELLVEMQRAEGKDFNSEGNLLRYKSGNGVEGIVVGKDYEKIDKNKDGRILISEMYPLSEDEVLEKILAVDGNFSKTQFKSYVRALFMLLQKAWSNNNYRALRPLEADSLYFEHKARIEDLIERNCFDKRENIGIRGCLLKEFKVEGDKEVLIVALTARMTRSFDGDVFRSKEWLENKFVKFDNNMGNVPYIMTFMRNKGVKTKTGVPLATSNCSNCGAVINVDDNGVCTYCNTSLVSGEVDWVLVDIKNIELVEY